MPSSSASGCAWRSSAVKGPNIETGTEVASTGIVALIHRYTSAVADAEGRTYVAEAHGRKGTTGLWEGWLEFVGIDRQIVLRTPTETRQSDRRALAYWAAGLEPLYLEGSLARAIRARLADFRT